jgi:N-formylglutamate amidohydrolase
MTIATFKLVSPSELQSSIIFASPHSGRLYSPKFLETVILDPLAIRTSEDAFVDELFNSVPSFGAPLLVANVPRAFIDLNRDPGDLDPILISGAKFLGGKNGRSLSGFGVIPRLVSKNKSIYSGKINLDEAKERLLNFWYPYHQCLQDILDATRKKFGHAVLIDCHSMPHQSVNLELRETAPPQIVLGDRFGAAASRNVVDQVHMAFSESGFRVSRNVPFAGAYISQKYGNPQQNQHVIQVEIDRSLFMNEVTIEKLSNFSEFQITLSNVISKITQMNVNEDRLAAE